MISDKFRIAISAALNDSRADMESLIALIFAKRTEAL